MRFASIVTILYGLLILLGGVMGYFQAQSMASLLSGLIFGLALLITGWLALQGTTTAGYISLAITVMLIVVFIQRLSATGKFMPSGMLLGVSVLALILMAAGLFLQSRP